MSIIKTKHDRDNPYVVINNSILRDPRISCKAKGLFCFLMSNSQDWDIHVLDLKRKLKEGEKAIYAMLHELIEFGYCERFQPKFQNSKTNKWEFEKVEYIVYEIPKEKFKKSFPLACFGDAEVGDAQKPDALISNKKKEISKERNNNLSCTNSVHKSQPVDNQQQPKKHISTAPPEIKEAAANAALASDDAHKKKNFSFEKIDEELCEEMVFQIKEQCPTFKDPTQSKKTWKSWLTSMNRLRRIDKRDIPSIRQMMKFIYNDDFWCKNILSPQKLREQYDNIWMRAFGPQKNIMQNKKVALEAINTLKTIDKDTLIINHSSCHDAVTGTIFSLSENPSEFRKKIMKHFHLKEDYENRINYERKQQSSYRL